VSGWNVPSVLTAQMEKWPRFVAMAEGSGTLGFAHESDLSDRRDLASHNAVMSFAYAISLAAHMRNRISFLDWGGGLGHFLVLGRRLFPNVQIEYHCKELPLLARQGARLFPDQHFTSDDACLDRKYDFVMASTSLHYVEDWRALLGRLGAATGGILYVTGLPVVAHTPSFVFLQRPRAFGYDTEYLAWCLNRDEFLTEADASGLRLLRELAGGHRPPISGAAEQAEYCGFLFRPSGEAMGTR
jgi:putative methyltransferase (TIGR04325 family)